MAIKKLKDVVDRYMQQVPEVKTFCDRCLNTERWDGNVLLMIVDAAFNSIGLNYFHSIVPAVEKFRKTYIQNNIIATFGNFTSLDYADLSIIWKNRRSWHIAKEIVNVLATPQDDIKDKPVLRRWARQSRLDSWKTDPIGSITGIGINTFQYLRMMGGVDTVMPDKIVKRILQQVFQKAQFPLPSDDLEFIRTIENIAPLVGYRAIELCWMTWLIQSENNFVHMQQHVEILSRI